MSNAYLSYIYTNNINSQQISKELFTDIFLGSCTNQKLRNSVPCVFLVVTIKLDKKQKLGCKNNLFIYEKVRNEMPQEVVSPRAIFQRPQLGSDTVRKFN